MNSMEGLQDSCFNPRMQKKVPALAVVLFLVTSAFGQTIVQRTFVMRAETTSVDPYSGMTHVCVLVYPDGRYRMERSFQGNSGGDPSVKVYTDTLPENDLKSLQSILDDNNFEQIKTAPPHGGIIKDMDTLYVTIPREHGVQMLNFNNAAERRPFEKTLKAFQNSLRNIEKRKVAVAKDQSGNNCEAPQVMYRSDRPMAMPNSN